MFDGKERYGEAWEDSANEPVVPAGWISARNVAGIFECSVAVVRDECSRRGVTKQRIKRVSVSGESMGGTIVCFPKVEALAVMEAWEERREARARYAAERPARKRAWYAKMQEREREARAKARVERKEARARMRALCMRERAK